MKSYRTVLDSWIISRTERERERERESNRKTQRIVMHSHAPFCQSSAVSSILCISKVWRPRLEPKVWSRLRVHRWLASSPGFGPQPSKKSKKANGILKSDEKRASVEQSEVVSAELMPLSEKRKILSKDDEYAPRLTATANLRREKGKVAEGFEEKLAAIKRSAEEKKREEQQKLYGPIDYDAPETTEDSKTLGFPAKVGIGIAVVVFGLIFAFGDVLPSRESNVQKAGTISSKERDSKMSAQLKKQLEQFLGVLKEKPDDLDALEGAAVSYSQLGNFSKSESTLLQIIEKKPADVDALRLLGEVQSALGKFVESASSYRIALKVSSRSITLWKGLAEALVSQGKPDLAIKEVSAERDRITSSEPGPGGNNEKNPDSDEATLVQINLLLGKIYADWGHVGDALAVYESIIRANPDDFRGYLAKGILLKEQGQIGEAERMFIQASFFAPQNMKALVDRYAKR